MSELVRQLVDKNREDIAKRLRDYLPLEQFISLAYNLDRNPKLAEAAAHNPESLLMAILEAADAGLLIGSAYDHCSLVTFKVGGRPEVQLMVEYRGLVYQLVRAGAVYKIDRNIVYDGDFFEIRLGDEEVYDHRPAIDDDRRRDEKWVYNKANMKGAYAVAWLPDPLRRLKVHRWCTIGEIEKARGISRMGNNPDGAWVNHYPAMALKTAVRRVAKMIEVCGPTEENREAWERFGKTITLDDRDIRREPTEQKIDDLPGATPGKLTPKSGRKATEVPGKQGANPPPHNGEKRTKAPAAQPPSPTKEKEKPAPLPPPTDEPISLAAQIDLTEKATNAGFEPDWLRDYIQEKYQLGGVKHLRKSQAAEIEQYIRSVENDR